MGLYDEHITSIAPRFHTLVSINRCFRQVGKSEDFGGQGVGARRGFPPLEDCGYTLEN